MPTTVFYHGNCFDGMGAAWAVWKTLGDTATYHPVQYGSPLPVTRGGDALVFVDFCPSQADLQHLWDNGHRITVLDHHKTAQAAVAEWAAKGWQGVEAIFDMDKSGAMLAWEHFHPGVPAPTLIRYVQDRDLWRWALPWSREVSAVTACQPYDFSAYDAYAALLERDFQAVVTAGTAVQAARAQMVTTMAANVTWREIGGYRVPVANATVLFSEVGEALCVQYPEAPFAAYYFDRGDQKRHWGLRSRTGFDVSDVAKRYGGGGHAAAAGFVTEVGWLPE